jgi:hypothetical protein
MFKFLLVSCHLPFLTLIYSNSLQILTNSSYPTSEILATAPEPYHFFFQLYVLRIKTELSLYFKVLRKQTHLPIISKCIQSAADARRAMQLGCQGIAVDNHGGRALEDTQPAILTLLELHYECPEIFRAMEVMIDGGIRSGSDILKALCLGARAVGLGRPFLYGVNYGLEGIEHVVNSTSISFRFICNMNVAYIFQRESHAKIPHPTLFNFH